MDLYIGDREWLADTSFTPKNRSRKYEEYLHSIFWALPKEHRRVVFLLGQVGCGKSTLIDYYLRCYCPNDPESKEYYDRKLVINVDVKRVQTIERFNKVFYRKASKKIDLKCKERGIDYQIEAEKYKDYELLVDLKLSDITKMISDGFPNGVRPFKYIVLCIDNIDQSPVDVQDHAIQIVRDWLEPDSEIDLWQVFFPMWPDTFEKLIKSGKMIIPPEDYLEVLIGQINGNDFFESRAGAVSRGIENDGKGVIYPGEGDAKIEEDNGKCVKFIRKTVYKINQHPSMIKFVQDITFGDLRRMLEIWHDVLASDAMFYYYRNIGYEMVGRYQIRDAMLTGFYHVHHKGKSGILNLYYMIEEPKCERDLLIGPHVFFLLHKKVTSYGEVCECLMDLGYTKKAVYQTLDNFKKYNFFHLTEDYEVLRFFEIHKDVINAYEMLHVEDVYLDNIAMTTAVRKEIKRELKRTVAFRLDDFVNRVETTINFIKYIREEEEAFCRVSKVPDIAHKDRFKSRLMELKLPILWRSMALSYYKRLSALSKERYYLYNAKKVTEEWWEIILNNGIFTGAESCSKWYLMPDDDMNNTKPIAAVSPTENDGEESVRIKTGNGATIILRREKHMGNEVKIDGDIISSAVGKEASVNAHDIVTYKTIIEKSDIDADLKEKLVEAREKIEELDLSQNNKDDVADDLSELTEEVSKTEPNARRVQRSWRHIKEIAPTVAATLSSAVNIANLLGG